MNAPLTFSAPCPKEPGRSDETYAVDNDEFLLTVFGDEHKLIRAIERGARGYLLKDEPAIGLVEAIEQLGWENLLHLRLGDGTSALRLLCRCEAQRSPRRGETVGLRITTAQAHLFHRGGDRDGQRR